MDSTCGVQSDVKKERMDAALGLPKTRAVGGLRWGSDYDRFVIDQSSAEGDEGFCQFFGLGYHRPMA